MDLFDNDKSRSQKKRESTALQKKGEELAALAPAALNALPLPPDLRAAFAELRGIKSREARRRHMQYIGRLMREMDNPEEALSALEALQYTSRQSAARFGRLEETREALLAEDDDASKAALARTLAEAPSLDAAKLRRLVEAARAERAENRPQKMFRELFRYLKQAEQGTVVEGALPPQAPPARG